MHALPIHLHVFFPTLGSVCTNNRWSWFTVGLGGDLEQELGSSQDPADMALKPTLAITPWMEKQLQQMAHLGGELNMMWIGLEDVNETRFIASSSRSGSP